MDVQQKQRASHIDAPLGGPGVHNIYEHTRAVIDAVSATAEETEALEDVSEGSNTSSGLLIRIDDASN